MNQNSLLNKQNKVANDLFDSLKNISTGPLLGKDGSVIPKYVANLKHP